MNLNENSRYLLIVVLVLLFCALIYKTFTSQIVGVLNLDNEGKVGSIKVDANYVDVTDDKGLAVPVVPTISDPVLLSKIPNLDRFVVSENVSITDVFKFKSDIEAISLRLKKNPTSYDDWVTLALRRKTVGDYIGSADALVYAESLNPVNLTALINAADLYQFYIKLPQKAEEILLRIVMVRADYTPAYRNLHVLYLEKPFLSPSKAEAILAKGLVANPGDIDLLTALASHFEKQRDLFKAKEYYQLAVAQAQLMKYPETITFLEQKIVSLNESIKANN